MLTSYKSVCSSLSKLQYAVQQGLDMGCQHPNFPRCAGRYASEEVLLWARDNGMPWSQDVCTGQLAIVR
jgi:hypothetical protein